MREIAWREIAKHVIGGQGWWQMKIFIQSRLKDNEEIRRAALDEVETLMRFDTAKQVSLQREFYGCDVRIDRECLPFVKEWILSIER